MYFSHLALDGLALSTVSSTLVSAVVLPRGSATENPASQIVNLLGALDVAAATAPAQATAALGPRYTIPQNAPAPILRGTGITTKRLTFNYGPPVAGGPYYPTGVLGAVKDAADLLAIQLDLTPELAGAGIDDTTALANTAQYDGLDTVQDYTKLYPNNWKNILPDGPDPGSETNFTQDLFFSMERLSNSPYQVRRLNPKSDSLSFTIPAATAKKISGSTLQSLFSSGSLFYADYRDQAKLPQSTQYAAACDAYFYIDSKSGEFLPLAIRTNLTPNLIYTPLDSANDWLLAKIMFNVNDFWFAQWNHLAATHEVVQIAYMAAIRTLSDDHPVLALLNRLMFEVFAIQPLAAGVLFIPGGVADQLFPFSGSAAQAYTTDRYFNKGSGQFQANYFQAELQNRGLINSTFGPQLKNFPFYEDGSVIWNSINKFMTTFVGSYYSSNSVITKDTELQNWVKEAQGPAKAIDFPTIQTSSDLVAVLTHFAHLATINHHTVNTNELLDISSTLPSNPPALFKPPPTAKGVKNPASYLPPLDKVLVQFTFGGLFARPKFINTPRTLLHMFDDANMLSRMNAKTTAAAKVFMQEMTAFSGVVGGRSFDSEGLSQGMPFVWQALDPNVAPYSITT